MDLPGLRLSSCDASVSFEPTEDTAVAEEKASKRNKAHRANDEKLYDISSGIFISLVQLCDS